MLGTLNRQRTGQIFMLSLIEILSLQSGEARLICATGHIAGHPHICRFGCEIAPRASGTVADVIAFKPPARGRRNAKPILLEDGWLVNGHHRVSYAYEQGIPALPALEASGVLAQQKEWHQTIIKECQERHNLHRDTPQR